MEQKVYDILVKILKEAGDPGLDLALVLAGVKPGDSVYFWTNKREWVASKIEDLVEIGAPIKIIQARLYLKKTSDNMKNIILESYLYYHHKDTPQKLVDDLIFWLKTVPNDTRAIGAYYGYPKCCIDAFEKGIAINEILPYTEHRWCSVDCNESKIIQEKYRKTLHRLFPWLPEITSQLNIPPEIKL